MTVPTLCVRYNPELTLTLSLCLGEWISALWFGQLVFRWHGSKGCQLFWALKGAIGFHSITPECSLMWFFSYFCGGSSYISPFLIGTDQLNSFLSEAPKSGVYLLCPQAKYLHSNKSIISARSFSRCSIMRLVGENEAFKIKNWDPWDVCPGRSETRQNDW